MDATGMEEDSAHGSYFVPMVDMLAGVVFLLVIMLASSVLVTREDFAQTQEMQTEIRRIAAELEAARAAERQYLEPRRRANAATRLLLDRLAQALKAQGYAAQVHADEGRLAIRADGAFRPDQAILGSGGGRLAETLAGLLADELPCLAFEPPTAEQHCAPYGGVRLQTAAVVARHEESAASPDLAKARALRLLAEVAGRAPALLELRSAGGADILTFAEAEAAGADASTDQTVVELRFQMQLPPMH